MAVDDGRSHWGTVRLVGSHGAALCSDLAVRGFIWLFQGRACFGGEWLTPSYCTKDQKEEQDGSLRVTNLVEASLGEKGL